MTDDNQEYSLGGFGARLQAAREAMNLSQKDAALRLHLHPNIVQILESEDFEKAPPATFMRGYLRSYARLLNFSEEEINVALTQSGLETQTRTPVVPTLRVENMQMSDRHFQWISTVVVLGLFIFVGGWWGLRSSSNNTNTLARSAQPVTATPVTQPVAAPASAPPSQVQQTVQPQPVVTAAVPANPATQTATPVMPPAQPAPAQNVAPPTQPPSTVAAAPVQPPMAAPAPTASVMANTPSAPLGPVVPGSPAVAATGTIPPIVTMPTQPNTAVASSDTPRKRHRHHRQEGVVSGFSMALPEPGL